MAMDFFPYMTIQRMCVREKITISVRTFYREVVANRVKAKMAIKFFSYMPIQRM